MAQQKPPSRPPDSGADGALSCILAHLGAPERPPAPTPQTRILTDSLHMCFDDTIEALGPMPFPPSMGKVRRWQMCPEMATLTGRCLLVRGQWGLLFLTFPLRRPCPLSVPAVHGHHRFRVTVPHRSQHGLLSHCPLFCAFLTTSLLWLRLPSTGWQTKSWPVGTCTFSGV